jgi:signal transduction histidine kinase/CheY-like chemotaxis protein
MQAAVISEVSVKTEQRAAQLLHEQLVVNQRRTDRMFAGLMAAQWLAGILAATIISPRAWEGLSSHVHIHVWAAVFLGGVISSFPIFLAIKRPGTVFTRHAIAVGQMLTSALLIHLTGGRLETHFHIFGSLAFLAFYQDWRVLLSATIVVAADHALRGIFWPQSVFGVLAASPWRWVEHAGWVIFEDIFLVLAIKQSLQTMQGVAERQAKLEAVNEVIEREVADRTAELSKEVEERKRAERQVSLQFAISRIMAEPSSTQRNTLRILEVTCEHLQQDAGLLWMIDHREGVLRCTEEWRRDASCQSFCDASRGMIFAKGIGLPGRVWAEEKAAVRADLTADNDAARAKAAVLAGLRGGFAVPILGQNGLTGVIEFYNRSLGGSETGLLEICRVIGGDLGRALEYKRVQEHLIQSQKMETVGKLAGGIAHEFNSIMTAIIGQSELLAQDLPTDSPLLYHTTEVNHAAQRAAGLTRQLLAYGRKQMLRPEVLDLNALLANMSETLRHVVARNTEVLLLPSQSLKSVKADAGQVEQVILNVVMNATDAMPNGGRLTLETGNVTLDQDFVSRASELRPGDYVMVAVSDTGAGMSEDVRARAFEPFFTTKEIGKGTGLGLATCHGIVKQSQGYIGIYSELGRGTTVRIYFPMFEEKSRAAVRSPGADMPRGTETILMVEDDNSLREMTSTLLRRLGYKVHVAANGVDAMKTAHGKDVGHIDLLFTDIVMPHMNGKELAERLGVSNPRTKILFTSAYTENSIVHQGILDPGIILLQKPFSPGTLARKVRELLDDSAELEKTANS